MHLELPKVPLSTRRDFLKHYLMIVLSILTALGLESWIERVHHTRAAVMASIQMDQELRMDRNNILAAIAMNVSAIQKLDRLDTMIQTNLKSGTSSAAISQKIHLDHDNFRFSLQLPDISTNARDVAVANHAVTWMAPDRLGAYSKVYTGLQALRDWEQHGVYASLDLIRAEDLRTDLELGQDVDPIIFLRTLRQVKNTMREANANMATVDGALIEALGDAASVR
jgi:hypothetical protein